MSKSVKVLLIIAISFIVVGGIFCGVMAMLNWDFAKLSTVKYETNNYTITEDFSNISVKARTANIVFAPSVDETASVVCYENAKIKHNVCIEDGALVITRNDTRKWYDFIGINFASPKLTVYIPKGEYGELSVKTDTGDIEIPEHFKFKSIEVSDNTGDVTNNASASEAVKIKNSTGKIKVEDISAASLDLSVSTGRVTLSDVKCEGDIKIKVSTGKTYMTNVSCKSLASDGNTGDISLNNVEIEGRLCIERSTGDVTLEGTTAAEFSLETDTGDVDFIGSDADEIYVETDTGHVKGTLLSEKIFITQTDTGNISVPESVTGGKCKISTDTGDIKISIIQ